MRTCLKNLVAGFFLFCGIFLSANQELNAQGLSLGAPECSTIRIPIREYCGGPGNIQLCQVLQALQFAPILENGSPVVLSSPRTDLTTFCTANGGKGVSVGENQQAQCQLTSSACPQLPPTCSPSVSCARVAQGLPQSGVTSETFDELNAAIFGEGGPAPELTTPRGIISRAMPYLFVFGGLTLFVMLLWGGFEMLTGAANPKNQEAGRQRITAAIIGFILLFVSYWFAKILEIVFGISVL